MTEEVFPLWPDNPSPVDLLGFEDIALPIVEVVGRDRLDPVVVGLYGAWGSGKSTILELVSSQLSLDPSIVVVRVTPWEYDATTDVKAALIGQVLAAVTARINSDEGLKTKLSGQLVALAKRVRWSKAIGLAARGALTLQVPSIEEVTDIFGPKESTDLEEPTLAGFHVEFASLMADLGESVSRLAVIVDDLDRCMNPAVIAILEGIKLFLAVPKMAFVVAADETPVIDAIAERYSASEHPRTMARQYLEKIVQIPLRVPALGLRDTEAYLAMMLLEHLLENSQFDELIIACNNQRRSGNGELIQLPPGVGASTTEAIALAGILAPNSGPPSQRKSETPEAIPQYLLVAVVNCHFPQH